MDKPQRNHMRTLGKGKKAEEFGGRKVDDTHLLIGCKLDMHRTLERQKRSFGSYFVVQALNKYRGKKTRCYGNERNISSSFVTSYCRLRFLKYIISLNNAFIS